MEYSFCQSENKINVAYGVEAPDKPFEDNPKHQDDAADKYSVRGVAALMYAPILLFSDYHTTAGLMGSEDKYLGYLDVSRGIGSINSYIGYVVTCQGIDTFIDIGGTIVIAMKACVAKVRFNKSGL